MNVPLIDKHIKPYLFTSYLVGWKGFFYIATTAEGIPIRGSIENMNSIVKSIIILVGHIGGLFMLSTYLFNKKDILS
jgi:ABC-2 type transport system permease protein